MERNEIYRRVDHTLLAQSATWNEIKAICDDGVKYGCASVCIPASYVKQAAEYVAGKLPICTVIGFPNGYDTTAAKCFMATDAVENGAEEVDMVINLGWVKDQKWDDLLAEIKAVKAACKGRLLKVIIECCFLTDEEKIKMCEIVTASGAEYIKTSTGFGTGGATREDVALFAKHVGPNVKIKAAGGIADGRQLLAAYALGACGAQVGTCLLVSQECPIHENYKQAILKAKDSGTIVTGRIAGTPVRILKNQMARTYVSKERAGATMMELEQYTLGSLRRAVFDGDTKTGSLMAGQVAGMLHEIKPLRQIFEELSAGCDRRLAELRG